MPDEDAAAVEPLIEPDQLAVLDEEVLAAPAALGSTRIGEELGDVTVVLHPIQRHRDVLTGVVRGRDPAEEPLAPRVEVRRRIGVVDGAHVLRCHRRPTTDTGRAAVRVVQVRKSERVPELVGEQPDGLHLVAVAEGRRRVEMA